MVASGLARAQAKMRAAGIDQAAIAVFSHYYQQLAEGATGLIREDQIKPLAGAPELAGLNVDQRQAREALAQTVIIKLNGGLGTGMGMDRAKSLLPVRDGRTFLDLIAAQVRHARSQYGVALPLLLMDSFRTQQDSLAALAAHPDLSVGDLPLDFLQNQEPKITTADLSPVEWPADPDLEWCPPGHGDIYTAISTSGLLDRLLALGYRYANASNADNLGASPSAELAGWFAGTGAPFAMEICRRTPADRKGGHLAVRASDGQLILRDTAQTAPEDMDHFTDENRHPYFNTNNLWVDLVALRDALADRGGVLGLPLIRNVKNVDPRDSQTPEVYQIETAMGAAIEVFPGSQAIVVPRGRFLPVKTTSDLLVLRSDAYEIAADAVPRLAVDAAPLVGLDNRYYRTMAQFEPRFAKGAPSLRAATRLTVSGDWTFGSGVTVVGTAELSDLGGPSVVPDGATLGPSA